MSILRSELSRDKQEKLNRMGEEERAALQNRLQSVQEKCLNAIDAGQTLCARLKERTEGKRACKHCCRIHPYLRIKVIASFFTFFR